MDRINKILTKLMPIITPLGILVGFLFPQLTVLDPLVVYLFAVITFSGALSLRFKNVVKAVHKPKYLIMFMVNYHIILPVIIYFATIYLFPPDIIAGFMLLFGIPTAVASSIWTDIHDGDLSLALAIIIIDSVLSPILVPLTLQVFTGVSVAIDSVAMMKKLSIMVVLPALLGMFLNSFTSGKATKVLHPYTKPFSKLFLLLVIAINTANIHSTLATLSLEHLLVGIVCLILVNVAFLVAFVSCKIFKVDRAKTVALTYTIGLRNISASFVLAISFFPPETSLVIVFGILFQQFIGAMLGKLLFKNEETVPSI